MAILPQKFILLVVLCLKNSQPIVIPVQTQNQSASNITSSTTPKSDRLTSPKLTNSAMLRSDNQTTSNLLPDSRSAMDPDKQTAFSNDGIADHSNIQTDSDPGVTTVPEPNSQLAVSGHAINITVTEPNSPEIVPGHSNNDTGLHLDNDITQTPSSSDPRESGASATTPPTMRFVTAEELLLLPPPPPTFLIPIIIARPLPTFPPPEIATVILEAIPVEVPQPAYTPSPPRLEIATGVEETLPAGAPSSAPIFTMPSPFEEVSEMYEDFEAQTVALHSQACGLTALCNSSNGHDQATHTLSMGCAPCHCDAACHLYDDCCPDVQLLDNFAVTLPTGFSRTWNEMKREAAATDVYTCEKSHMKIKSNEGDYGNSYPMINYCPRSSPDSLHPHLEGPRLGASGHWFDPRSAELTWQELEARCENQEGSGHWRDVRPVRSLQGLQLTYRNQFCAQCHGEGRDNLTAWRTSVTCAADLLYTASSKSEAYFLALNTTGCDVRFSTDMDFMHRHCYFTLPPVISSCNQTGEWVHYDERVERACASFTSVVKRQYKNAFCFMCNVNMNFRVVVYMLEQGSHPNIIGRLSFFALLDLDDMEESSPPLIEHDYTGVMAPGGKTLKPCGPREVRDPLNCQCRAVTCASGLGYHGNNCTEVFSSTNYFGFRVCARFRSTSQEAIEFSEFYNMMSGFGQLYTPDVTLLVATAEGVPRFDCDDNTTLTVDVAVHTYSLMQISLREMAQIIHTSLHYTAAFLTNVRGLNTTVSVPYAKCPDTSTWPMDIPNSCSTKNRSVSFNPQMVDGNRPFSGPDFIEFSTLYNTTFCPRVNLTETEFANYSSGLAELGLSADDITHDATRERDSVFHLLCVDDFHKILSTSGCVPTSSSDDANDSGVTYSSSGGDEPPDTIAAPPAGFTETWTTLGVLSLVCTCVSLAGLVAVVVTYSALPPLRQGSGLSTLSMACLLLVAQALYELGAEQYDYPVLCLTLALLIHFFWLAAVFMMTCCTLQLFFSVTYPLRARVTMASRRTFRVSLLASCSLAAVTVGATVLGNQLLYGDVGYPGRHVCFIRRSLSRHLGFGLPLGVAVTFNVTLFVMAVVHIRGRPRVSSTQQQDRVSLLACFRLSAITGACWLSLFLLALPGARPWLEYVAVALLGLQGLMLASTLLINKRVLSLWRQACCCGDGHQKTALASCPHTGSSSAATLTSVHTSNSHSDVTPTVSMVMTEKNFTALCSSVTPPTSMEMTKNNFNGLCVNGDSHNLLDDNQK